MSVATSIPLTVRLQGQQREDSAETEAVLVSYSTIRDELVMKALQLWACFRDNNGAILQYNLFPLGVRCLFVGSILSNPFYQKPRHQDGSITGLAKKSR